MKTSKMFLLAALLAGAVTVSFAGPPADYWAARRNQATKAQSVAAAAASTTTAPTPVPDVKCQDCAGCASCCAQPKAKS